MMDYEKIFGFNKTNYLPQMWAVAQDLCNHILRFKPDVLLVLMHSGWGAAFSARVLWLQTQTAPFPPIACTNIGSEKTQIFGKTYKLYTAAYFVGEYAYTFEVGKYLAWVATRADWHAQLRSQIEEALQSADPPRRILVVDDTIHEGSTILMTTEMLYRLYPQAETRFLGIGSLFSSEYGDYMLKNFAKVSALFPDGVVPPDERPHLIRVAIGSEDIIEDSLDWRPISVDSPSVQVLSKYLPASEWVEISQSIYASIADYIIAQSDSYEPGEPEPEYLPFRFKKEWYIFRDVWLENRITRRQIEARFDLSTWQTRKILKRLLTYGDLTIEGRGRSTHYVISEALREHYNKKPTNRLVEA